MKTYVPWCTKIAIFASVFVVLIASGCSESPPLTAEIPSPLRIGVVPNEDKAELEIRYEPVINYLSETLGVECQLVVPDSYEDMVEAFANREIDIGRFGGYTFVLAHERTNAIPIVMREIDIRFTSYFLVRPESDAQTLADLAGQKMAFGSNLSTSGHLMPRHFMKQDGIEPETFFESVQFTGSHDKTAYWVRDGVVDAGAANAKVINEMFEDGRITKEDIRILWETPPYASSVWALNSTVDEGALLTIRDAFLTLSYTNPEHRDALDAIGARSFLPASMQQFEGLQEVVKAMRAAE
jgi:phosphonate transport system substrate-binding protein